MPRSSWFEVGTGLDMRDKETALKLKFKAVVMLCMITKSIRTCRTYTHW